MPLRDPRKTLCFMDRYANLVVQQFMMWTVNSRWLEEGLHKHSSATFIYQGNCNTAFSDHYMARLFVQIAKKQKERLHVPLTDM